MSDGDSMFSQIMDLIGGFNARVRALVSLALVSILAGLIWVIATSEANASRITIIAPMGAFLGLAILLLLIAAALQIRPSAEHEEGPVGGEFVLGCLLGRQTVAAGMLRVRDSPGRVVPSAGKVSVFTEPVTVRLPENSRNSWQLCDELAAMILKVLDESRRRSGFKRCHAIGIAIPGIIDPRTGKLNISVTLPEGTDVPRELARRLLAKDSHLTRTALKGIATDEYTLARHIFLDNDVRCIARHELSEHQWEQFACLYAGSGVGGAFVVDRQVYYGANGSASHIGHLEVEALTGSLLLATGQTLGPVECDCGIFGFHLDAFANYNGFRRIVECIAADPSHQVLDVIQEAQRNSGLSDKAFYHDVFPEVVAAAGSRAPADLSPEVKKLLAHSDKIEHLALDVLRSYVGILVSGLSTLIHMFDPGIIVICGSLIERLQENDSFAKFLRETLPGHLVDSRARPQLASAVAHDSEWQGAALLAWDGGYQRKHVYLTGK